MTTEEQLAALRTPAGQAALAAAGRHAGQDPLAAGSALRKSGIEAGLAAAALTQAELRRRAVRKFGTDAGRMFFTRAGLEQATRSVVAARRAARLAAAGVRSLVDLGCGIGADALAAARAGISVTAVEADPLTAAIAQANAVALGLGHLVRVQRDDATRVDLAGVDAVFCDPARRRSTGRRVFDPDSYSPPWSFVSSLPTRVARTVLKLAPGIDHALVPAASEAEWVSVAGDVVEATMWCGPLAGVARRATLIPPPPARPASPAASALPASSPSLPADLQAVEASLPTDFQAVGASLPTEFQLVGTGLEQAPVGRIGRFLFDPDGAVVRAHLVAEFAATVDGRLADPTIAYVYADQPVGTPFARCFEVLEVLPFSVKRLRAALRTRGVGRVEIHKRGSAVDVERLRRDLRLSGDAGSTVMLTRVAGAPTALLCTPAQADRPIETSG